ncbi:hypothetical protein DFH08DRAFT_945033 [Mycena albidolilacea]|uniref:Uncharacterized protein n=1 Tax=Mycena albidolilacea TaxID=1033008 RepID=A0AAD7EAF4_9AGAR|nr:hypothetical protein DFH08DRAFT_945033 [Mycena albidolilacea]
MTPKLCAAETMLWFYLKVYLSVDMKASRACTRRTMVVHSGVYPGYSNAYLNYFVYPATTSPNPDSRAARPIQVHFNNFNLELNYSGLKLNVPGTRLITSQVMLNYHTSQCFLALLDSFSCFTEPQARVYHFRFLESSQSRPDRSYGTITQRLSHLTGTYAHSETPLTSNSHPVSSRHKVPFQTVLQLGRPNSLPPDFTYGLHTETYFISSMSTIVEESNIYCSNSSYISTADFIDENFESRPASLIGSKGTRKRVNSYSTTSRQPGKPRLNIFAKPSSKVLVHALNSASSAGWSFQILCPPQHRLKFLPLKQKLLLAGALFSDEIDSTMRHYGCYRTMSPLCVGYGFPDAPTSLSPSTKNSMYWALGSRQPRGPGQLPAFCPRSSPIYGASPVRGSVERSAEAGGNLKRYSQNLGTVIDPEVTVFTLAAPCPSRPDVVFVGRANIAVSDIWHEDSVDGIHQVILNQDADCATLDTLTEFVGIPPPVEN